METEIINGHDFLNMLQAGLTELANRYQEVDSLNVFPVPDGDTGTNMYLTFTNAVEESRRAAEPYSIGSVSEAAARGALMGARGNSGVILSQFLRGIAKGLKDMDRVAGPTFAQALQEGVKVAYKAIMKPVEGTILTVAREAASGALAASQKKQQITGILQSASRAGEAALQMTPDMLPALKEAGVVDAGGMGWVIILKGFESGLNGRVGPAEKPVAAAAVTGEKNRQTETDMKYPYCTEVLIKAAREDNAGLKVQLAQLGDSFMLVDSDGMIKVHLHTDHPGTVLEACLDYGFLMSVKIDNMMEQVAEKTIQDNKFSKPERDAGPKPFGIVSVAAGEGIKNLMENLGTDMVIMGGQTMNPSTQELYLAVEAINSGVVIILPNNKNIIMTAEQVSKLTDKEIVVVPTKSVPQGLAALLSLLPGNDLEKAVESMTGAAADIKTGEITYAVRNTVVQGREIQEGSIIGLYEDEIVSTGTDVHEVAMDLLKGMIDEDDEVCSLYYGEMIDPGEAGSLVEKLQGLFPDIEFELLSGGQPLYYYLLSVE